MHLVVVGHATHTPSTLIISEVKFSNKMKQDKLSICLVNAIFFLYLRFPFNYRQQ